MFIVRHNIPGCHGQQAVICSGLRDNRFTLERGGGPAQDASGGNVTARPRRQIDRPPAALFTAIRSKTDAGVMFEAVAEFSSNTWRRSSPRQFVFGIARSAGLFRPEVIRAYGIPRPPIVPAYITASWEQGDPTQPSCSGDIAWLATTSTTSGRPSVLLHGDSGRAFARL